MNRKSGMMLLRQSWDMTKEYWVVNEKRITTMAETMMMT